MSPYDYLYSNVTFYSYLTVLKYGHVVVLKLSASYRNVAGSLPNGVIGTFHLHTSSGRTVALGSTQYLTETSTRRPVDRVY